MRLRRVSRRAVMWLCLLLLAAGTLPMYALSFYNHAFYDDMGFSLLTRDAWTGTGNLLAVLEAAWRNTVAIRGTWEGTYTSSFLSTLQPAVFGEGLYFITTFVLLTLFLLALLYFLWQTLRGVCGVDRAGVLAAFGALGFVLTQFLPSPAEGFYWFNGGVAYTLLWALMLATAGLWLRFERGGWGPQGALRFGLLLLLSVLLGGAKYSTALFALLLALCGAAWAFLRRRPKRWALLVLPLTLGAGLLFSAAAPGNGVRAQTLAGTIGAPKAVAEALYFGLALLGHGFMLPLLAALLLVAVLAAPALKRGGYRFAHPLWVTAIALALFCAQLTPTLYTGNYLGDGRVLNTYYDTLVLLLTPLTLYWTGYCLRRWEGWLAPACQTNTASAPGVAFATADGIAAKPAEASADLTSPDAPSAPTDNAAPTNASATEADTVTTDTAFTTATGTAAAPSASVSSPAPPTGPAKPPAEHAPPLRTAVLLGLLMLLLAGCIAFHPDGASSYGPQNMAGGSALRSLMNGSAAAYDAAMDTRDLQMNDPMLTDVALAPVGDVPPSFMGDALTGDNLEYVLRLYAEYYHKATVRVAGQGN